MAELKTTEFDGAELHKIAASLLMSIHIDKNHLAAWNTYKVDGSGYFKPEEIESAINLYTRLINESIAIRHKVLNMLNLDPHPEFI